jgi:hypothetical protein
VAQRIENESFPVLDISTGIYNVQELVVTEYLCCVRTGSFVWIILISGNKRTRPNTSINVNNCRSLQKLLVSQKDASVCSFVLPVVRKCIQGGLASGTNTLSTNDPFSWDIPQNVWVPGLLTCLLHSFSTRLSEPGILFKFPWDIPQNVWSEPGILLSFPGTSLRMSGFRILLRSCTQFQYQGVWNQTFCRMSQ